MCLKSLFISQKNLNSYNIRLEINDDFKSFFFKSIFQSILGKKNYEIPNNQVLNKLNQKIN